MITGVRKIVVPVGDLEQAKRFWTEVIGFEATRDETYGDERWVEVAPYAKSAAGLPDAAASTIDAPASDKAPDRRLVLVLSPRPAGQPRHEPPDQLPHSDVFFHCDDVQRTYEELTARGVRFPAPPQKMHFGWWALFEDNEGTRYALGQWNDVA